MEVTIHADPDGAILRKTHDPVARWIDDLGIGYQR
jgi:hypothetical protein